MLDTPVITTRLNALLVAVALSLIAAVLSGAAGFALGHRLAKAEGDAALSGLRRDIADRENQATAAALARFKAAQARGDALESRLATAEAARKTQALEHARELKRLTTGRPCLNAGTVRLLNEPTERDFSAVLPATTGGTDATDGASASDTDVAGWIDGARRQYDVCRGRLGALIDWYQGGDAQ
jgi:hypothetical protein